MPEGDFSRAVKWGCGLYIGWAIGGLVVAAAAIGLLFLACGGCTIFGIWGMKEVAENDRRTNPAAPSPLTPAPPSKSQNEMPAAERQRDLQADGLANDSDASVLEKRFTTDGYKLAKQAVKKVVKYPESVVFFDESLAAEQISSFQDVEDRAAARWKLRGRMLGETGSGELVRAEWEVIFLRAFGQKEFRIAQVNLDGRELYQSAEFKAMLDRAAERQSQERADAAARERERLTKQREQQAAAARKAEEEKKAQAARDKPLRDEKDAATELDFAKRAADAGDKVGAAKRLRALIQKYPDTKAAAEAKQLLQSLGT